LAELSLILPHGKHSIRVAIESAAARLGLAVNVKLKVNVSYLTMELGAQGMGRSIMPLLVQRGGRLPALAWQKFIEPALETPPKKGRHWSPRPLD
jgi:LysR family transcriptional regulator, nitrogen assimilation regulatory protein